MAKRNLIEDGRLTIPLYHGTSTLFYDSIVACGLGGRNIVEDFGIRSAARLLLNLFEEAQPFPEWKLTCYACSKVAEDPTERKIGCRYGIAYLSPSPDTAIMYSRLYGGSEALACTYDLLRQLSAVRPDLTARKEFAAISDLAPRSRAMKPLVIEIRDIEVGSLLSEAGKDCAENFEHIEYSLNDPEAREVWEMLLGQTNFELQEPVTSNRLRFYEVLKRTRADGDHAVLEPYGITTQRWNPGGPHSSVG